MERGKIGLFLVGSLFALQAAPLWADDNPATVQTAQSVSQESAVTQPEANQPFSEASDLPTLASSIGIDEEAVLTLPTEEVIPPLPSEGVAALQRLGTS